MTSSLHFGVVYLGLVGGVRAENTRQPIEPPPLVPMKWSLLHSGFFEAGRKGRSLSPCEVIVSFWHVLPEPSELLGQSTGAQLRVCASPGLPICHHDRCRFPASRWAHHDLVKATKSALLYCNRSVSLRLDLGGSHVGTGSRSFWTPFR